MSEMSLIGIIEGFDEDKGVVNGLFGKAIHLVESNDPWMALFEKAILLNELKGPWMVLLRVLMKMKV